MKSKKVYWKRNSEKSKQLLTGLFLFLSFWCSGQNVAFNHLSVENGLSQNSVLAITQDTQGFMWFGTRYGLNRYDTRAFKTFKSDPNDSTSLSENYVLSLFTDSRGKIWAGTTIGLNWYDPNMDAFHRIIGKAGQPHALGNNSVHCIYEDRRGRLWFGTSNGLNLLTNRSSYTFASFFKSLPGKEPIEVRTIVEDHRGDIWVGTSKGLIRLRYQNGTYLYRWFKKENGLSDDFITTLAEDTNHTLWIGTKYGGVNQYQNHTFSHFQPTLINENIRKILISKAGKIWIASLEGLYTYEPDIKELSLYRHDPENRKSLGQNSIYSIYQDTNGSVWIGTYYGGVDVVYSSTTPFVVHQNRRQTTTISNDVISSIVGDGQNNLWIGTEGGGLNYYNPSSGSFTSYKHNPANRNSISSNLVKSIFPDRSGKLWISTHLGGLNEFDPKTNQFRHYRHDIKNKQSISSDNVIAVAEDAKGRLWVGTDRDGINVLDRSTGTFEHISVHTPLKISGNGIRTFFLDSRKNFWIGTENGLNRLDPSGTKMTWFLKSNTAHLKSDNINCILEDSKGTIWVGTYYGGLSRLNKDQKSVTTFTEKDGLPNDNILGIQEDNQHYLWLGTDDGLCRFDPQKGTFKTYTSSDGLPGNEFSTHAYYKNAAGELFFGTYNGLVHFDPGKIVVNRFSPPLVFTALKLFNKPVTVQDETHILNQDISIAKEIIFKHDQSIFSIDFALLNYIKSNKNKYAYKLEGFEKDWNYVKTPSATYTNLPAGEYTFLAKGANNDGVWNDKPTQLHIRVLPPFWATWWAYLLYLAFLSGLLFFVIRFFWLRESFRRNYELHQFKLNFFTNISHEIRTHLTLIAGPVEKLLLALQENPSALRQLQHVQNNTGRLLKLVSELMDFRKVESENLKLKISKSNIVAYINEIFQTFQDAAETRGIHTSFESACHTFSLFFDPEQLEKVIYNLLTNAFKFTPDGGHIRVFIQEQRDTIQIRISNTGKGIAPENMKKLFNNYFQIQEFGNQNTGYGIGLALSKSIVELHKGTISVESTPPTDTSLGLTSFTVSLRQGSAHFEPEQLEPKVEWVIRPLPNAVPIEELMPTFDQPNKPIVLLVEDNPEVRGFIYESLATNYQVIAAENGLEGWNTAINQIPDLVVSDVMMPEMDGLTLCQKLKSDERTSHIPVLLLTARATQAYEVSSLELGADSYVTKPFSIQILQLKIRNLLTSRERMRYKYTRHVTLEPQNTPINTIDEAFLNKLIAITERHLDHPGFGVTMLATEVAMSAPVLYKKLKALTDLSVNDFIKSIRLKKAAQLLEQKQMTVYEVAYAVGFEDRKYFSREFKKYFGKTPSEYTLGETADF
ncbi:MAG: two-component regulator propeller domain-containing protein [Siphonobacter sp.]